MFQDLNPLDRSTALLEIGIMLLVAVLIGFLTAWLIQQARRKSAPTPAQDAPPSKKLQATLANLKKQLAEKEAARKKLAGELSQQQVLVAKLPKTELLLKKAEAGQAELEKQLKRMTARAKRLETEAPASGKPDARLDQQQKEIAALTGQKQELQARLDKAEADREDTGRLDRLQKELAALRAQNAQLKAADGKGDGVKGGQDAGVSKGAGKGELAEKLAAAEKLARDRKSEIGRHLAEIKQLKAAAEQAGQQGQTGGSDALQREVEELKGKLKQAEAAQLSLQTKADKASDTSGLQREVDDLKAQLKAAEAAQLSLQAQADKASDTSAMQSQLDDLKAKLKKAEAAQLSAQAKSTKAQDKLAAAQAEHEKAIADLRSAAPSSETSTGDNSSEIDWLRREKEDQEAEIAELEDQISHLEKDNARWRSRARGKVDEKQAAKIQELETAQAALLAELAELRGQAPAGTPTPPDFSHLGQVDADQKDPLSKITGIGPVVESKLNALGIFTFQQVSRLTPEDMSRIDDALQLFPGRVKREKWVKQAKKLGGE